MVADGYDDCENDMAARVRALVGETAKIGVLLDPHCEVAEQLVEATDVIVIYKEYPHTDIEDRGEELVKLVLDAASGEIDPVTALFDCRMVGNYPTWREPMRSFVDGMIAAEERAGVLSISLAHCFPWGGSVDMGVRALVVTDGDAEQARAVAEQIGRKFFALRRQVDLQPLPLQEALDKALASISANGPVVVADVSDNAGGGAPSDSTFALRELLERKVENAALAMVWDPIAVQQAFAAGEGATLEIRLGGKMGPQSGDPLDLRATVTALAPELVQHWPQTEGYLDVAVGECARLTVDGVDVVVSSTRHQVLGLDAFSALGIDPTDRDLLVVKSSNHFYAAFGPIAAEVIYMSTPGALSFDYPSVPYKHLDTHKYPWVEDPWLEEPC
jgi:microcystin degradation protein MlrC